MLIQPDTPSPADTLSPAPPEPPRTETPTPAETLSPADTVSARVSVEWKRGHLEIPHTLGDNLYPLLEPHEQVVYQRLYRLSHGHGRDWCVVGLPRLVATTRVKQTRLVEALRHLERLGLVERLEPILGGPLAGRGNRYRVHLPEVTGAPAETPTRAERVSRAETVSPAGSMKVLKETHENVEQYRRALSHEFRQRNPHATDEEIRRAVDEALVR